MKIFILFIIATLSTAFGSNIDSLYVKGNEHYLEGEFNDAIENYEKILSLSREAGVYLMIRFLIQCLEKRNDNFYNLNL